MTQAHTDSILTPRAMRITNASGAVIPPYSALEITGIASDGSLNVGKPSDDNLDQVLFSGASEIPIGAKSLASGDWPLLVTLDGSADVGDEIGTVSGQWYMEEGNTGFVCLGTQGGRALARPFRAAASNITWFEPTINCEISKSYSTSGTHEDYSDILSFPEPLVVPPYTWGFIRAENSLYLRAQALYETIQGDEFWANNVFNNLKGGYIDFAFYAGFEERRVDGLQLYVHANVANGGIGSATLYPIRDGEIVYLSEFSNYLGEIRLPSMSSAAWITDVGEDGFYFNLKVSIPVQAIGTYMAGITP